MQIGLQHLHQSGVMYRALAAHTVLLDERGSPLLTDFRFAAHASGRATSFCGQPEYLAPELVLGKGHSEAVDWWALGVLIFRLVSGSTPFASPGALLQR